MAKSYRKGGLYAFKVNRPLSADEISDHLPQKEPSRSAPWFQLTVIRMNSTFLECVDMIYAWRGAVTAVVTPGFYIAFGIMIMGPSIIINDYPTLNPEKQTEALIAGIYLFLIGLALTAFLIWALRFECFKYTHYPTRFNRKTRMVHYFRPNGTVLSVPWDKVYFTLMYHGLDYWEVVGHVLSDDGKTVLDTFPLSTRDIRDDGDPNTTLYQHWEFVRRYMEEGPQELYEQVAVVLPIHERKESYIIGWKRLFANFGTNPLVVALVFPVIFCVTLGRWLAMRTCKLPRWPQEVEAQSKIEPDDPYIRDERHLPGIQRVEWD